MFICLDRLDTGTLVRFDQGTLRPLSYKERVGYALSSDYRAGINEEIERKLTRLFTSFSDELSQGHTPEKLGELFFSRLSKLDSEQFRRCVIPKNLLKQLRLELQSCEKIQGEPLNLLPLAGSVAVMTEETQSLDPGPSKAFQKALQAVKLSMALEPMKGPKRAGSGTSWVGFLTDVHGKERLVMKPEGLGPSSGFSTMSLVKNMGKRLLGLWTGYLPSLASDAELQAEVTATLFAQRLGIHSISETHAVRLNAELGKRFFNVPEERLASFQLFVRAANGESATFRPAGEVLQLPGFWRRMGHVVYQNISGIFGRKLNPSCSLKGHSLHKIEQHYETMVEAQKFWIFDYLIGNLDRHEQNWFLKQDAKTGDITGVMGIDQGASFYLRASDSFLALRHQYQWAELEAAELPFTPEAREMISHVVAAQTDLHNAVRWTFSSLSQKDREAIQQCLQDRISVLEKILSQEASIPTPKALGQIKTEAEIRAILA